MHGDPELIFPSKTKFSDCLRNGMPSHLGGFIPLVTDPFAVLIFLLLTHYHHLMALLLCMLKKKIIPLPNILSSVPSLISSTGDANVTKTSHFIKCQLKIYN